MAHLCPQQTIRFGTGPRGPSAQRLFLIAPSFITCSTRILGPTSASPARAWAMCAAEYRPTTARTIHHPADSSCQYDR